MAEAPGASGGGENCKLTRAGICEGHCVIAYVYIGELTRIRAADMLRAVRLEELRVAVQMSR